MVQVVLYTGEAASMNTYGTLMFYPGSGLAIVTTLDGPGRDAWKPCSGHPAYAVLLAKVLRYSSDGGPALQYINQREY